MNLPVYGKVKPPSRETPRSTLPKLPLNGTTHLAYVSSTTVPLTSVPSKLQTTLWDSWKQGPVTMTGFPPRKLAYLGPTWIGPEN